MTTAAEICTQAAALVSGERARQHGDKQKSFEKTAALWSSYLDCSVSPDDVAMMMVLLKVSRTQTGAYNPDNYVDLAGYSGIAGEVAKPRTLDEAAQAYARANALMNAAPDDSTFQAMKTRR